MTSDLKQLVDDTVELTGAAPPTVMDDNAPVLQADEQSSGDVYFVGIIGGKEVGKSSLVNALVGRKITEQSAFGPGTETVIAYAHQKREDEVRRMLDRHAPGRYRVVTHDVAAMNRQVLLDLPDVDSIYDDHIELTRRMLRHMLFPIWVQSVEKYADLQPQQLLAAVAEGNDPANFLFCLNKVDQVIAREGAESAEQLRVDYANRLGKLLGLPNLPHVRLISATHPDAHDLPALRKRLAAHKAEPVVRQSLQLAERRGQRSILRWVDDQNLPDRQRRTQRLLAEAQEMTASRILSPLLDEALPAFVSDSGYRAAIIEPVIARRMARWPIVNAIHGVLSPLVAVVQKNLGVSGSAGDAPIDEHLRRSGRTLGGLVQSTFAHLHQTDPTLADLYRDRHLWESAEADSVANNLRRDLAETLKRQREIAVERVSGKSGVFTPIARWALTIGAALWFPIVQPVLEAAFQDGLTAKAWDVAFLLVKVLSATHLLESAAFLSIYFVALWMLLRWNTANRVDRLIHRWSLGREDDAELSLTARTVRWTEELCAPLHKRSDEISALVDRANRMEMMNAE